MKLSPVETSLRNRLLVSKSWGINPIMSESAVGRYRSAFVFTLPWFLVLAAVVRELPGRNAGRRVRIKSRDLM
jgi:hypothetical protein